MPGLRPAQPAGEPEAALSLSRAGLTGEVLGRAAAGQVLAARVIRQLEPGRYLLDFAGTQVTAESRLALSAGDRLSLLVRQAGSRVLMDLVASAAQAGQAAPAPPGAPDLQPSSAPEPAAGGGLRAEVGAALARSAPLGRLLDELGRLPDSAPPAPAGASDALAGIRDALRALPGGPATPALATPVDARLAGLLAAVESLAAELLAALPAAAAIDSLAALLPAPGAPAEAGTTPAAGKPPEARADLAGLLERLLATAETGAARQREPGPGLPRDPATELAGLPPAERALLGEMLAARERALLGSSPELAWLGRVHQALSAAQDRAALCQAAGAAGSDAAQGFVYQEIPSALGPGNSAARLRVLVRHGGDRGGGGAGGAARGPVRAVLDVRLSALGEVWTELTLTDRNLVGRIELPDRARRDFVAAALPELEARLEARGLSATLAAEARRRPGEGLAAEAWPGTAGAGGVDLWA